MSTVVGFLEFLLIRPKAVSDPAANPNPGATSRRMFSRGFVYTIIGIILFVLSIALGPIDGGIVHAPHNAAMERGRQIGQMLFSYATDNIKNRNFYPDGASSTEVFQKLLDGGYCDDPSIFYVPMKGKVRPEAGQKVLKPENVSWDVTGGVDSSSPDPLPLVFLTGWKVIYAPSAVTVPLIKPYPRWAWDNPNPGFFDWLFAWSPYNDSGMAVFCKGGSAFFEKLTITPNGDGSIPNFIPPDFKPDGRTYRQLTPDGVLP
jgi:hypothetical protein